MPTTFLKIPHIRQKARADCLVACAMMMLAAVDIQIDYFRLRTLFGVTNAGVSYSRLKLLSRIRSDLRVTLKQGNVQDLMAAIDTGAPPAAFVATRDLPYWSESVYHALVLVGYTETEFYINDPAFAYAPQVASIGNFDLAWLEYDTYFAMLQRTK